MARKGNESPAYDDCHQVSVLGASSRRLGMLGGLGLVMSLFVMTPIWVAMCIYLLLAFIKFQPKLKKGMPQILCLLQLNLFEKRDLLALLRGNPIHDRKFDINQMVLL